MHSLERGIMATTSKLHCPYCLLDDTSNICSATERTGNIYHCRTCNRFSKPIRIAKAAQQLLNEPLAIRQLITSLISSYSEDDFLFCVGEPTSFCRWEMAGLGRTRDYPVEFRLLHLPESEATVVVRHAVLEAYGKDECKLPCPAIDESIKARPILASFQKRLEALGMKYIGIEGPASIQHFVFGKTFTCDIEGQGEHGVIAILRLRRRQ
jgi:hypothetical protein